MFHFLGYLMYGFIYCWMVIIATVPNVFMSILTTCILATLITYFIRRKRAKS